MTEEEIKKIIEEVERTGMYLTPVKRQEIEMALDEGHLARERYMNGYLKLQEENRILKGLLSMYDISDGPFDSKQVRYCVNRWLASVGEAPLNLRTIQRYLHNFRYKEDTNSVQLSKDEKRKSGKPPGRVRGDEFELSSDDMEKFMGFFIKNHSPSKKRPQE